MYSMDNLLTLARIDHAHVLRIAPGSPPVVVLRDTEHKLEGPPITPEIADQLLRSVATTRHLRRLREGGSVQFMYTLPGGWPFLIRARLRDGQVAFEAQ